MPTLDIIQPNVKVKIIVEYLKNLKLLYSLSNTKIISSSRAIDGKVEFYVVDVKTNITK